MELETLAIGNQNGIGNFENWKPKWNWTFLKLETKLEWETFYLETKMELRTLEIGNQNGQETFEFYDEDMVNSEKTDHISLKMK